MEKIKTLFGTHNSVSYLKPIKWWMNLLKPFACCQKMNINEQLDNNIRYFDIRIIFDEDNNNSYFFNSKKYFAHGLVKYEFDENIFSKINSVQNCYCRLILEDTICNSSGPLITNLFVRFCEDIVEKYPNIKFHGGFRKSDYLTIYKFKTEEPVIIHAYGSYIHKLYSIIPWIYAKIFNFRNTAAHKNSASKDIMYIDFINKKYL